MTWIAKPESWHWGEAIYNQIMTWTAFAILAMFIWAVFWHLPLCSWTTTPLGREGKQGASLTEVVRFHLEDRRLSENGVTNESTILATQRAVSETGQRPSSNLVLPPWQGIKMSSANAVFYLSRPSIFVHNKHALGLSGKLSLGFNKKSFVQVHKKRLGSFTK